MNTIPLGADLITIACYVAVTILFQPASRTVSRLALMLSVAGCLIQATVCVIDLGSILLLRGLAWTNAFTVSELQSVTALLVRFHDRGFNFAIFYFGLYCLLIGCLILRSRSMARTFGALMVCGGLACAISSLTNVLAPYATFLGGVGEGSLILWLLVIASNARWKARPSSASASCCFGINPAIENRQDL
jgi:hypothetical protein